MWQYIRLHLCFTLLLLVTVTSSAQEKHTLSGYVRGASDGEALIGVNVIVDGETSGTVTNSYGFYSLTLPADTHKVVYSFVGYQKEARQVALNRDVKLNIDLTSTEEKLEKVEVTAEKNEENVERAQMGVMEIPVKTVQQLPALLGQKDILKSIQLLPGVQSGNEGTAGFYVRGGGPDQNKILLDEAVVYNPYHLAGFMSVFNMDAIKDFKLYKGGFPAQFGGRLSSILDIKMKEGNNKKWHGKAGIGAITSRLTLEGPIVKDKASFMVSGRFFYLQYLLRALTPKSARDQLPKYTFYDINAKANYKISDKDKLFLSGYLGNDVINLSIPEDDLNLKIPWGNRTLTARWNHLFNDKLFSNTTFIFNDYVFEFSQELDDIEYKLTSGIRDLTGKTDFDYYFSPDHHIKFGAQYTYHTFIPNTVQGELAGDNTIENQNKKYVHESAVYVNDEYKVTDDLSLQGGLRAPFFLFKDTRYWGLEPRFTAKYSIGENMSVKTNYTYMNQFVHLLSNSTATTPIDLWIPSSDVVKPQRAHQVGAGLFRNFMDNTYETSIELYYKKMNNQIAYEEGANVFFQNDIDDQLVFGEGWSYGAEFFVQKRRGKFNGWIGYTLSWTKRHFDELNEGQPFPAKYDRRHDLSATVAYEINDKWTVGAVFVYGTGHSITLPNGQFNAPLNGWGNQNSNFSDYVSRNNYKLRPYHRLDLGLTRNFENENIKSQLKIDIYNVYSRRNPYFVYLTDQKDPRSNVVKTVAKQVSLLPIIPSLSYNIQF